MDSLPRRFYWIAGKHHFQSSQSGITTFGICNESASTLWKLYILWPWSDWKLSWPQSGTVYRNTQIYCCRPICQLPETSGYGQSRRCTLVCIDWQSRQGSHLYCHKPIVDFCFAVFSTRHDIGRTSLSVAESRRYLSASRPRRDRFGW